jgi:hypothetical protein
MIPSIQDMKKENRLVRHFMLFYIYFLSDRTLLLASPHHNHNPSWLQRTRKILSKIFVKTTQQENTFPNIIPFYIREPNVGENIVRKMTVSDTMLRVPVRGAGV